MARMTLPGGDKEMGPACKTSKSPNSGLFKTFTLLRSVEMA